MQRTPLYYCIPKPFSCHSASDPTTVVAAAYCSSSMPGIKHLRYAMKWILDSP
jgi:hypothetical protein